ncbi:MAG: hypothetical protein KC729_06595, partial [Candidatus Eisenbacteria bacterium]|nr:hypothetical protein [Candidatus Eisenbacteria bacterium]
MVQPERTDTTRRATGIAGEAGTRFRGGLHRVLAILLFAGMAASTLSLDPSAAPAASSGFDALALHATDVVRRPPPSPVDSADGPGRPARLVHLTRASADAPLPYRLWTSDHTNLVDGRLEAGQTEGDLWVPIEGEIADSVRWILGWGAGDSAVERVISVPGVDRHWVLHFNPGFHYDPVWWNTQAHYTETGFRLSAQNGPGLDLVSDYLRMCEDDPDYRIALHQIPYLKTFLERHPERRAELAARVADDRASLVGGTYNELSSTLVSAEATIRNAIYGTLFQKEVLSGGGRIFWQCDVFGHDPSFPSIMRASGHDAGAFARGPFHQWGAPRDQVNFPSEFLWMSPDGNLVLTHYMTGHYGYAYGPLASGGNHAPEDPGVIEQAVARMFEDLKRPALTHHVLLPMHQDFVRPLDNLGEVVRLWNETHLCPRATISTPRDFFVEVQEEIHHRELHVPVVTRDMNPIYTGCGVSFADLKIANRECETLLRDAEILATLATVRGAEYPWKSLDRAWRQLQFNAHHDGVTGSMSDQVYLDILAGYRDAAGLARDVRARSLDFLRIRSESGEGLIAWNGVAHSRTDRRFDEPLGGLSLTMVDPVESASPTPRSPDESDADTQRSASRTLENDALRAVVDLERGGVLTSLYDKRAGREILTGPGNDLTVLAEYDQLPGHAEGPWHLAPTGSVTDNPCGPATVIFAGDGPAPRLEIAADSPLFRRHVTYELAAEGARLDVRTEIRDWRGTNQLLRVQFPCVLPGAKPIYETAAAVIGRPFARDVDTKEDSWTLDQTFWQWVGLGSALDVEVTDADRVVSREAVGVAEIVL